jgi:two-component system, OmpR family, osmolarity sensor histidine kinase EnvZ
MSSSPIETGAYGLVAKPAAALRGAVAQGGLIKRLLPRTLFGRSILIIVTPLVVVQLVATWVFYDRHWDTVARRLAGAVAGEIAYVIETQPIRPGEPGLEIVFDKFSATTDLDLSFRPGARLASPGQRAAGSSIEGQLAAALDERVGRPFELGAAPDARDLLISLQLDSGVLDVAAPRKRLYTSTTYIFILWMVGSSLVLFAVATMFMRNQVRSLRRLAAAADSFGKGRSVPDFKLEGAAEIRQAGRAFLAMRDRIRRQITQRTEMLAGVSHDLRTPLTRMKLALALVGDNETVAELRSDVEDMERMVQGYLDFARGAGSEEPVETDLLLLLEEVATNARRDGASVSIAAPEECVLPLRPNAMRRCLANLVGNARRHGSHIWITVMLRREVVDILIDDDGPGIPPEKRDSVFRPFFRIDASRNPATGGVGLGLTIARDVARGHGGDVTLETSPQGGLRARVHLPR